MSNNSSNVQSSSAPWFRFFASDWLSATRGLKPTECGILVHLIAMMHERGEPIAEDHAWLARLCGTTKTSFAKSLEILVSAGQITRIRDNDTARLWNSDVQREIEYREEKSQKAKTNSQKRWGKDQQNQRPSDATAMLTRDQISEGAAHGADAQRDISTSVTIGGDKEISQSEGSPRLSASPSETGEEEAIIPKADEIDLDSNTLPSTPTPEHLDGPHTGDRIEIGEGASIEIAEDDDETPDPDDDDTPFEGDEWDEMIPFDSWSGTPTVAATDTRASNS